MSQKRFANLRIRTKVVVLVVAAAGMAVTVGGVAQNGLADQTRTTQALIDEEAEPALAIDDAFAYWGRYRGLTLQLVLADDAASTKAATDGLAKTEGEITTAMTAYEGSLVSASDKARFDAVQADYDAAVAYWKQELQAKASRPDLSQAEQQAVAKGVVDDFGARADKASDGFIELIAQNKQGMQDALAASKAAARRAQVILWSVAVGGTAALVLLGLWIARMVAGPVARVRDALKGVADGDLTHDVELDTTDEVGEMAKALNRAQAGLRESMHAISAAAQTLSGSAEELSAVSAQVAASADETSAQSGAASAAAEQVSRNVQTVAAATEEMSSSIGEISQSSTEAVRVAQNAADEASAATGTVSKLGDSSREIGDVVKVITSIAEQTNLLALNATIEAARAGEAGKGFAVVAAEVKDLAQETARATDDISKRIAAIQVDSQAAVTAIASISEIIEQVNSYQTTIASAVEEQTATTQEMSRNVSEAAMGSSTIAENIESVATAAQSSSTGILEAQRAAAELAQMSGDLRELVSRFRY